MGNFDFFMTFTLHPQLAQDSLFIADLPLSQLRLLNDSRYLWCLLVPRRANVREIYELTEADQQQLLKESSQLGQRLMQLGKGDKLNVAALGNVVPQLHVHHVVRKVGDEAWPAPVWGKGTLQPYSPAEAARWLAVLANPS
jgi:diadenosine tetraphosphate (Ap4A) HIT family hydrolase